MWALWLAPTIIVGHAAGGILGLLGPRTPRGRLRPGFVRGPAAFAWLYEIPPGLGLDWVGAVTLGHVILHRTRFFEGTTGQLILAHELAHTRQHDVLGPFYLPLHILAQTLSALLSLGRAPAHTRVHDHNPLEQTFICLGASAYAPLARGATAAADPVTAEAMLTAFGLPQPASRRSRA
jgi:hypothetical protein